MADQIIDCPIVDRVSETENAYTFTLNIPEENKSQFHFTFLVNI